MESLEEMIENGKEGTYDFAFIDADKTNYKNYYEILLKLIRTNGIIALDNVLWIGRVLDESVNDEDTVALRGISKHIYEDDRVEHVLLPFADGVPLVRKK
jgi:predicted O-methyltransferase YrrM